MINVLSAPKLKAANEYSVIIINTIHEFCANLCGIQIGSKHPAIRAVWESGYMDFGADFRRKYSSQIYISLLPESKSEMTITAQTDKKSEYMEKKVNNNLFSWEDLSFEWWTFETNNTPRIRRVRLKIKKFVYYKLIFRVERPGAGATVLGYDQEVRFASMAK